MKMWLVNLTCAAGYIAALALTILLATHGRDAKLADPAYVPHAMPGTVYTVWDNKKGEKHEVPHRI